MTTKNFLTDYTFHCLFHPLKDFWLEGFTLRCIKFLFYS